MTIERRFDVAFVASLALREKQIQQHYRPIIAVHKWFARRPGTLFRSLILSEFREQPLEHSYFSSHNLRHLRIADPFMGGGTPLIEANRLGCDVVGFDINPMSFWIVREEIEHLDLEAYRDAVGLLLAHLEEQVGELYRTRCLLCGSRDASAKYFLWVNRKCCRSCGGEFDLFPGYLLAENVRHPRNVLVCGKCGELNEVQDRQHPGSCGSCGQPLRLEGPARRNRCACPTCGEVNFYPNPAAGPPRYRNFAIEYHCPACKPSHQGRFFKKPDEDDLNRYAAAVARWNGTESGFVPEEEIPSGDETTRLHRWGYRRYRELFNPRQLLGLELSARVIAQQGDQRIRNALATNLSDLLRYQNMLCRYDTMALKSLDIFSIHGFPVGLVRCESNLLGISAGGAANVGSGGWTNIVEKYARAKEYCDHPFEVRQNGRRSERVFLTGEWIGECRPGEAEPEQRSVELECRSATEAELPPRSLDAVFTDPPYFGSVQYAELMDFCYVWLRRLVGSEFEEFRPASTRQEAELTGNATMERGLTHFAEGLSEVFQRMAEALKPGAPLAFTYHHNAQEAYYPVVMAILDAGLTCSASLPCPAEMGASIHISGTGSSVVDTVFICRSTGSMHRRWVVDTAREIAALVREDIAQLRAGGLKPRAGDLRCVAYGHLARLVIWRLRRTWDRSRTTSCKLERIGDEFRRLGGYEAVEAYLKEGIPAGVHVQADLFRERAPAYASDGEISF